MNDMAKHKLDDGRDPFPELNRGEDFNATIGDIEEECKHALAMSDKDSLLGAIRLIAYLCHKTQTDEVE